MIREFGCIGMVAMACLSAAPAAARDDRLTFPIKQALSTPEAQARLDKSIRLYFGAGNGPAGRELGAGKTNKKTNAAFKSDQTACEWAFLSAVLALQERAAKLGGNAVAGIVSNYKSQVTSSPTDYVCGAGNIMAGVALKGRIIRVGGSGGPLPPYAPKEKSGGSPR